MPFFGGGEVGTVYETMEKPKTNLGKRYQHSAFGPELLFSAKRRVLQRPSAAF